MLRLAMATALLSICGFLTGCCGGPCVPCGGGGCGIGGGVGFGAVGYGADCGGGSCGAGDCGGGCGGGGYAGRYQDDCGGCGQYNGGVHGYGGFQGPGLISRFHNFKQRVACGAGCGEVYLDEWVSTPPYSQDPCDSCQNYTGRPPRISPCSIRLRDQLVGIYGTRFCEGCGQNNGACGCDSMGHGGQVYGDSGGSSCDCCSSGSPPSLYSREYQMAGRQQNKRPHFQMRR